MQTFHAISFESLLLASALVLISIFVSYRQELKLEKKYLSVLFAPPFNYL